MQRRRRPAARPDCSSRSTALKRYGKSRRLTTKPGDVGHLDGRLAERLAERAGARPRPSSVAASGKASSTSSMRGTGLKTCRPTKRSATAAPPRPGGRPRATRSSWRGRRPGRRRRPARRRTATLWSCSSATASTRKVAAASSATSVATRTAPGVRRRRRACRSVLAIDAARAVGRRVGAGEERHVAVARGGGGQAAGDGAASRDAELFLHAVRILLVGGWLTGQSTRSSVDS